MRGLVGSGSRSRCSRRWRSSAPRAATRGDDDARGRFLATRRPPATDPADQFADLRTRRRARPVRERSRGERHRDQGRHDRRRVGPAAPLRSRLPSTASRPASTRRTRKASSAPARSRSSTRDDTGDQTRNAEVARDLVEQENVFGDHRDHQRVERIGGVPERAGRAGRGLARRRPRVGDIPEHVHVPAGHRRRAGERVHDPQRQAAGGGSGATKVALIGGGTSRARCSSSACKQVHRPGKRHRGRLRERRGRTGDQADFTAEVQAIKDPAPTHSCTGMDLVQNAGAQRRTAPRPASTMKAIDVPRRLRPACARARPAWKARCSASSSTRSS